MGPDFPPTTVPVTVNGRRKITVGDLDERLKPFIFPDGFADIGAEDGCHQCQINGHSADPQKQRKGM